MAVNPMLSSGSAGINQGLRALDSVAAEVAEFNKGSGFPQDTSDGAGASQAQAGPAPSTQDVTDAMADLKLYQRQVQASAKVIETADQVLGFLLDVRA
ncbi:MAG: hypothetical protein AAF541_00600 [Pseudomonadota bacterium]